MTFADYTASDQSSSFGSHGTDQDAAACSQADPPTPPAAAPARRMVRHGPPAPPATAPTRSIPSYEVFSHPTTGDVGLDEAVTVPALRGKFSMRGPLFHAFVCYRVATEGPVGNRLSGRISERIRTLSLESPEDKLKIPRHGWGVWPKSASEPVPFRSGEAKVFLDRDCLQDGQSWLSGFVQGMAASMVVVPLLSWTADDRGSVGGLSEINIDGFDKVDVVLLELLIATALRQESRAGVQAILPVLVGSAAEGGGFEVFPFYKLARLSDAPSKLTNAKAAAILRQLGLGEDKVQAVLRLSVKQVVEQVIRNQGVQASEWGDVTSVATEVGKRVLETVLQEIQRLWSDPKHFEQGRPMGSEVLAWLKESNLQSYVPLFIHHNLDSLEYVARLKPEELSKLCDEHEELYPRSGRRGEIGGQLKKLELAHTKLVKKSEARFLGLVIPRADQRTLPISKRLECFRDEEASSLAIGTSGNGLELVHTKGVPRLTWFLAWMAFCVAYVYAIVGFEVWGARQSWLLTHAVCTIVVAVLPLVCRTARMFLDNLQWILPIYFMQGSAELAYEWLTTTTDSGFAFFWWSSLYTIITILLKFRRRYFILQFLGIVLIGYVARLPLKCLFHDSLICRYSTYNACLVGEFMKIAVLVVMIFCIVLLMTGRMVASFVWQRRVAISSRDHHRAVWRGELSNVTASPEVMDGLRTLANKISRALQDQKLLAVRSLGRVGRVTAFLNERAGRWSLRTSPWTKCKARQAHGDINLLFDEAVMVNEPFLDLMDLLVAGIQANTPDGGEEPDNPDAAAGLAFKRGPIKQPQRALQKLVRVYGRDVAMLTDLVRCTVVAEDLKQVGVLVAALDARSVVGLASPTDDPSDKPEEDERTLRITSISNRFDESYDDGKSGGYRDLSLSVEVGWVMNEGLVSFARVRDWEGLETLQRHICEIQVRLRSQHHQIVNEGLHTRYVELRNQYNG